MTPALSLSPEFQRRLLWHLEHSLPHLLLAGLVLWLLLCGEKFWMTNDDIRMSMTVGGYGGSLAPSPALVVESTVVWGWLVMHVPDVAGIRGYTLATYTLTLLSCVALLFAARRRGVPDLWAAAAALALYGIAILYPQFTLVAGYLAVAGFAQVPAADERVLWPHLALAALLLLLAGLIRPDELAVVFLVSAPFLLQTWRRQTGRRWRRAWLAVALVCALLLAAAFLATQYYSSSGDWQAFATMDTLRGEFTDYRLGPYLGGRPDLLATTPLSVNDLRLINAWFYLDPTVFKPEAFTPLLHAVSTSDRLLFNLGDYRRYLRVLEAPEFFLPFALFVLCAALNWRRGGAALWSCLALAAIMLALLLLGRPGILRVFLPAVGTMLVLALMQVEWRGRFLPLLLGLLALAAALGLTHTLYERARYAAVPADKVRTATCAALPEDRLVITWTGEAEFEWRSVYRPTTPVDDACNPRLYSIGDYQLAPPSLAQLHAATGGKDLMQALLAGQSFYIVTGAGRLRLLDRFLDEHYHLHLDWKPVTTAPHFQSFLIQVQAAAAAAPTHPG